MRRTVTRHLLKCVALVLPGAAISVGPVLAQQNPPAVLVLEGPYDVMTNGEMHLAVGQGVYVNVRAVSGQIVPSSW